MSFQAPSSFHSHLDNLWILSSPPLVLPEVQAFEVTKNLEEMQSISFFSPLTVSRLLTYSVVYQCITRAGSLKFHSCHPVLGGWDQ